MVQRQIPEVDEFLATHPNMKDKVSRGCYVDGCKKRSRGFGVKGGLGYGEKGGDKISCNTHKLPHHVAQNAICRYTGCPLRGKQFLGNHKFCKQHVNELKEAGGFPEEHVTREKNTNFCREEGCTLVASFDNKTHCKAHSNNEKSDDKRRCDAEGCTSESRPTFGHPGERKTMCRDHKKEGMVSRKICETAGCKMSASYGLPGGVDMYCLDHKPEGYVLNQKVCAQEGCERQPCFGSVGGEQIYCSEHKLEGHVDLRNKRCIH